jgi:hypothetical protein
MDASGEHQNELTSHDVFMARIDPAGRIVDEKPEKGTPSCCILL